MYFTCSTSLLLAVSYHFLKHQVITGPYFVLPLAHCHQIVLKYVQNWDAVMNILCLNIKGKFNLIKCWVTMSRIIIRGND